VLASYYIPQTRALIQLPGSASTGLVTDAQLTTWINMARGQIAGEGECIRLHGTIPTVAGQESYSFANINTGVSATNGIQGVINIRSLHYVIGGGQLWLTPRPWPWFSLFNRNSATPQPGQPKEWAQFSQGSAPAAGSVIGSASVNGGSFYVSPVPDQVYTLSCNAVCYPIPMVLANGDSDPEALPYFWTDAVPFFAAYWYLMSAQTNSRMADAANMYKGHYNEFMDRARKQANAGVDRWIYDQAGDPAQGPKMGIKGGAQ
jgi:hypothetical protein